MFSKKVIRVVAIVMAVLMLLGVFGVALTAFATDGIIVSIPKTGQPSSTVPFVIGIVALAAAIICVVMSKKSKNKSDENVSSDYIEEEQVENGLKFFTSKKEDKFVEKPEDKEE